MIDWSVFLAGCGVGAVAIIVLLVLLKAMLEIGAPPMDNPYEDGEA